MGSYKITYHAVEQFILMFCSVTATALLATESNTLQVYGLIIGLLGQPFWVSSSISTKSWGILVVSLCFTVIYLFGLLIRI